MIQRMSDAEGRHNLKYGGGVMHISLKAAAVVGGGRANDPVALDDALNALARLDARKVQGGLSVQDTGGKTTGVTGTAEVL
jgi:hypothetical protein